MSRAYDYSDIAVRYPLADELRVPLVTSTRPRWRYITAIAVDPHHTLWQYEMPNDDEIRAVACFHQEYVERWYRDSFKAEMRERPYDLDGGANGIVFCKKPDGHWQYQKFTWQHGPWPFHDQPQMSLLELMDHTHSFGDEPMAHWVEWREQHAEVFAAVRS